jgi:epoxyqueuosine reductase QueG
MREMVIEKAKELGADIVGIAPVERFKNAPVRMSPQGLLPGAKSVIVCGLHHPDSAVELGGEPTPHNTGPYDVQGIMNSKLDDISFLLARFLEDKGFRALPIVSSNIWRYKGYKDLRVHFAPDIAHRYAAVAAGLGEIGWNGLFLHPEFGPRVRLVTIITDAELEPDTMYEGEKLCDCCMECVKNCPTDAFRKEVGKINEIEIGGKIFTFPDTNKWRCAWAENFGLNLALPIPEKVDEDVILENMERYGFFAGEEGSCLKFCMVPQKRYYDVNFSKAPRRKKERREINFDELRKIIEKNLIDLVAIKNKDFFKDDFSVRPHLHLPDVSSVISIGVKKPNKSIPDIESYIKYRLLQYTAFDIAHYLDINGYSAITMTRIDDNLVALKSGIWQKDAFFTTILTSAQLPEIEIIREGKKEGIKQEEFRSFCKDLGADLVGFFDVNRFEQFKSEFLNKFELLEVKERVCDASHIYTPFSPIIREERIRLKGPKDYLEDAKSVIVIGLHFPHSSLDTAKVTPAETVGPYAFAQFETLNLLTDIAFKIIKKLNDCGYKGVFSYDLTGLASCVISSRGLLPDMRANAFSSLLAGLACIGKNGVPITKEFGQRQRFLSIITDFPFINDPLYEGDYPCKECDICQKNCVSGAIKGMAKRIKIEDKEFEIPEIDDFACDWAKRYGLIGEEGTKYMGVEVNIEVPKDERIKKLCESLANVKWGVQKRHLNICEECVRLCPMKGGKNGKRRA